MTAFLRLKRQALGVCLGLGVLAGCGGSQIPSGALGAMPQTPITPAGVHRGSWILPEAKREDLLYLGGDHTSDVSIYTFPGGKLVGALTGLPAPSGMCADRDGNVWITNYKSGGPMLEYAHGGTKPIMILEAPKQLTPQDCSVDPTSGKLAVVGYGEADVPQWLVIYSPSGKRRIYRAPSVFGTTSFCGYDDRGDLFFDGYSSLTGAVPYDGLGELRKGAKVISVIGLSPNSSFPSSYPTPIQWDGAYLTVGTMYGINRYAVTKSVATLESSVNLEDIGTVVGSWIQGGKVVAVAGYPNFGSGPQVQVYKYPAGGYPVKGLSVSAFGVTVSAASRR